MTRTVQVVKFNYFVHFPWYATIVNPLIKVNLRRGIIIIYIGFKLSVPATPSYPSVIRRILDTFLYDLI